MLRPPIGRPAATAALALPLLAAAAALAAPTAPRHDRVVPGPPRRAATAALALPLLATAAAIAAPTALGQDGVVPITPEGAGAVEGEGGGFDTSFLRLMITSTGPIGVVLLLMSFYLIALVAWMFF